jgi:hypothetical protein
MRSLKRINPYWMTNHTGHLPALPNTDCGASRTCQNGWASGVFEYRQAQEIRDAFAKHGVAYLFIGKSGAVLLGFPDTTQDVDVFVQKSLENGRRLVTALLELGFALTEKQILEIEQGRDFVQLKNGPFDLDLLYGPDGIERFEDAWSRHVEIEGFHVCSIDDIIASKVAAGRRKDLESLPRLEAFRTYLRNQERSRD